MGSRPGGSRGHGLISLFLDVTMDPKVLGKWEGSLMSFDCPHGKERDAY